MKALFFAALIAFSFCALAQTKVEIKRYNFGDCNSGLDPYKIQDRVSFYSAEKDQTFLSIGFGYPCCLEPKSSIEQRGDTLFVLLENTSSPCLCDCCYSIDYTLKGKVDAKYFYFNGKQIFYSTEAYKVYPIKFELRGKDTINYSDRYGDKHGLWIYGSGENKYYDSLATFYENGEEKYYYLVTDKGRHIKALKENRISFEIIDGDTVNYIDIHYQKQGIHLNCNDILKNEPLSEMLFYKDDQIIQGYKKHLYRQKMYSETIYFNGDCIYTAKFGPDGKMVERCQCETCDYYTEQGWHRWEDITYDCVKY